MEKSFGYVQLSSGNCQCDQIANRLYDIQFLFIRWKRRARGKWLVCWTFMDLKYSRYKPLRNTWTWKLYINCVYWSFLVIICDKNEKKSSCSQIVFCRGTVLSSSLSTTATKSCNRFLLSWHFSQNKRSMWERWAFQESLYFLNYHTSQ